jgi:hypothetical protein
MNERSLLFSYRIFFIFGVSIIFKCSKCDYHLCSNSICYINLRRFLQNWCLGDVHTDQFYKIFLRFTLTRIRSRNHWIYISRIKKHLQILYNPINSNWPLDMHITIADPTFDYCLSQGFCGLLDSELSWVGIRLLSR